VVATSGNHANPIPGEGRPSAVATLLPALVVVNTRKFMAKRQSSETPEEETQFYLLTVQEAADPRMTELVIDNDN
jgi:hypothetical protein